MGKVAYICITITMIAREFGFIYNTTSISSIKHIAKLLLIIKENNRFGYLPSTPYSYVTSEALA